MPCMKMPVQSYRDLVAWQKAMELVVSVYTCTQNFPKVETYGLISQMRRAAVSVPSNIAEGHARISTGEFRQFLGHALGSLVEIETQTLRLSLARSCMGCYALCQAGDEHDDPDNRPLPPSP